MARVRMSASKNVTPRSEYWRGVIAKWEESDQTQVQFCREESLSISSFRWWKWKLASRDQQDTQAKFLPVRVIGTAESDQVPTRVHGDKLEIILPQGYRIRVPEHFSPDTLRHLIITLEGISC